MENIRIAILNKNNVPVAFMDNTLPKAMGYYNDILHTYLEGSAASYTFTCRSSHPDAAHLENGAKIAFKRDGRDYFFNIVRTEEYEREITCECFSLSFELLNETYPAMTMTDLSFEEALKLYDHPGLLTIGINEIYSRRRSYEWKGSGTALSKIYSLANVFDAEVEFVPELNTDYSLKRIIINVYKKGNMGEHRDDVTIHYSKELDSITKSEDITELYTAIRPHGKDNLMLTGYTPDGATRWEEASEGIVQYYKEKASPNINAPASAENFPSHSTGTGDKFILFDWETEYESQDALFSAALAKLKEVSVPKSSYTLTGDSPANIGDTIKIVDEAFNPVLFLEARVTEQEISFTDPIRNQTMFSNVAELENRVNSNIRAMVNALKEEAEALRATVEVMPVVTVESQNSIKVVSADKTATIRQGIAAMADDTGEVGYSFKAAAMADDTGEKVPEETEINPSPYIRIVGGDVRMMLPHRRDPKNSTEICRYSGRYFWYEDVTVEEAAGGLKIRTFNGTPTKTDGKVRIEASNRWANVENAGRGLIAELNNFETIGTPAYLDLTTVKNGNSAAELSADEIDLNGNVRVNGSPVATQEEIYSAGASLPAQSLDDLKTPGIYFLYNDYTFTSSGETITQNFRGILQVFSAGTWTIQKIMDFQSNGRTYNEYVRRCTSAGSWSPLIPLTSGIASVSEDE